MTDDRPYILRRTRQDGEDEYIPITTFTRLQYRCGLRAGDRLRLRRPLSTLRAPSGADPQVGQVWSVLTGSADDPEVVWLRQPDGELHSWSDDDSIFDYFEKVLDV